MWTGTPCLMCSHRFASYTAGVPRNMKVARGLEGRLRSLKYFATFNFKLDFKSKILELIIKSNKPCHGISKMSPAFFVLSILLERYKVFCSDFDNLGFI